MCPESKCEKVRQTVVEQTKKLRSGEVVHEILVYSDEHVPHFEIEELLDAVIANEARGLYCLTMAAGLPDSTGLKIAHIIAISRDLRICCVPYNAFTFVAIRAIARALQTNTSMITLSIYNVRFCIKSQMVADEFVRSLVINPNHPKGSLWRFDDPDIPGFDRTNYFNVWSERAMQLPAEERRAIFADILCSPTTSSL